MPRSAFVFALLLATVAGAFSAKPSAGRRSQQNSIPDYPFDPSTTRYCTWWIDGDGKLTCEDVQELFGVSVSDFLRWNPSVKKDCGGLPAQTSFCVAATNGRGTKTGTPHTATKGSPPPSATPTAPASGIQTPSPIQDGMVRNCKAFYWVKPGEGCDAIASKNAISVAQIVSWNPGAKTGCTELWANTYCCVGVM